MIPEEVVDIEVMKRRMKAAEVALESTSHHEKIRKCPSCQILIGRWQKEIK